MSKFVLILFFSLCSNSICLPANQEPQEKAKDKPLQLLSQPRPSYTEQARRKEVDGTVRLQVTFLANGEIGSITVIKAKKKLRKNGLVEQAIEAAKKIKFNPTMRDDKPASVVKIVEYNFNLY